MEFVPDVRQVDELADLMKDMEECEEIKIYLETKSMLEAGLQEMRLMATEHGNFQSRNFIFTQKKKIAYDWEGAIKKLLEEGKVKTKDMKKFQTTNWEGLAKQLFEEDRLTDDDVIPFSTIKFFGEARKRTQQDIRMEV